ncbi:MAG: hypothetical protein ACLPZM_07400 [Thermoplasmata archaeon]
MHFKVLDTFPAFETYWRSARTKPLSEQIDRWEHEYLSAWPELAELQKESYPQDGVDWKRVARTRVFPFLDERLPGMRRVHQKLLRSLPDSWSKTQKALGLRFTVQFVIYVGIGGGAGWATRFGGRPACLFGLENAAEMSTWEGITTSAAVSHEVAHLAHNEWRRRAGIGEISDFKGPFLRLYEEGFATECERRIESARSFSLRTGSVHWLPWCSTHRAWLARKFLRDVTARRSMGPFFGSWYKIRGQIECGYYLGQEVVREWSKTASLRSIAVLPEHAIQRRARSTLRRMAESA